MADLARMGALAAEIVDRGAQRYLEPGFDGQILRAAGRHLIVQVSTVVQRLPADFKAAHPGVEWTKIQRMRNLVAHHYDLVQDEFVWEALRRRIPQLIDDLGVAKG